MDRFQAEDQFNMGGVHAEDGRRLGRLAGRFAPVGEARLGLRRRELRRFLGLLDEARRLRGAEDCGDEVLFRLANQRRVLGTCARRAAEEGGQRLPAWNGKPRISVALEWLCADGDALTAQRLLEAVRSLDAAQPLTLAELWAAPTALRVALCRAAMPLAARAVDRARRREEAGRWVHDPGTGLAGRDAAFLAHALKRAGEEELPRARRRLDAHLARRGLTAGEVVARAQAQAAEDLMKLDKLLDAWRMIDALDWRACFRELSEVDRELRGEASCTYPAMDEPSREALRREVAHIARRIKMPEAAVARAAVDAARRGEGLRGEACWWLYDDAGRRALLSRLGRSGRRVRRMIPDPRGRWTVAALIALAAVGTALLCVCAGTPWLWAACVPLGWTSASALAGRFYARLFPPARLLKLEWASVPEAWRTLVTMPVLLSSPQRVEEVCDQLEALGCLEEDENIGYLLLGDLADAGQPAMPGDEEILRAARERVAGMNARAGRVKYAFLCRERTLLASDGLYMGRDRKRGALMDLNRLLAGVPGAEDAFGAEDGACERLKGRFACVVTLDADTRALPGDIRRLIGAMAHPLNRPGVGRGYAVFQPRMETLPSACVNGFVNLFAGAGGLNAYPITVSNLWQDLTGHGIYGGKGIYHVAAFRERLEGMLPEGRILSHDLAEGALAGAAFVGDVAFYDGHPATLWASVKRQHRWVRGDWQLLPVLFSSRPLSGADRYRMLDNLIRSLRAPALLALLAGGAWTGGGTLPAALAVAFWGPLLCLGDGDALKWRRALAELATTPLLAWNALDAVGRTLWRLTVSGKRLMAWVTAADAETGADRGRAIRWTGRAGALLMLPGLLVPDAAAPALALGALFWIGPDWIGDMESEPLGGREALSGAETAQFRELARSLWRFFEDNVTPGGSPLPPDNVQLDPPVGAARRTSPTNIALYLLGCLSAARLGFIGVPEMRRRMAGTLDALEGMEKWRGQLYNWYDIDTLAPLTPRYVSSVDSGNLAAALLACAWAKEAGEALAPRLRALAEGMDLAALYDEERELFFIGMDVASGRASAGHYDLLASEARTLSYVAMMLGQVPARHWHRLGRACARVEGGVAPLSWSGTMFEYLMPEILMAAPPRSMLGEGARAAVRTQIARGRRLNRPWGVSESGYCAMDAALNYQYRAFGLPELALDGEAEADVVAPYAAALAAMIAPRAAAANLRAMGALGWTDEWGPFEAADYLRGDEDGNPALVKSHMAHHQGMALCALCNVLTGDSLRADFMAIPQARGLSLLLEERACPAGRRRPKGRGEERDPRPRRHRWTRRSDPNESLPQVHLLCGAGATALCDGGGAVRYRQNGVMATRASGPMDGGQGGARVWLTDDRGGQAALSGPASFFPGEARYAARLNRLEATMAVCLSPEDGTLLRIVDVRNGGDRPGRCAVTDVVPVALCGEADWNAHAAFQSLFVEIECPARDALLFRRRPGGRGHFQTRLIHLALGQGEVSCEGDYGWLAGRTGDAGMEHSFDRALPGHVGATLNPAGALRVGLELAPGQWARVCFALGLAADGAAADRWLARWRQPGQPHRALALAGLRAGAMLDYIGLNPRQHHALQRAAVLLADGGLAAQVRGSRRGGEGVRREALWPLGLSGDRPIWTMTVKDPAHREEARALVRAHEFYRAMGVAIDLALVDDGEGGYARPVRDMLEGLISATHLNAMRNIDGGAWLIDGDALEPDRRRALLRFSSAAFTSRRDFWDQLREMTDASPEDGGQAYSVMDVGDSTPKPSARLLDNGFGGFVAGGYEIDVLPDRLPPAPWCNILANRTGGMLLSERGGGFFWRGNSRTGRLTPWGNDAMLEGWGLMLYLVDDGRGEYVRLLPGDRPQAAFRVCHAPTGTTWIMDAARLGSRVRFALDDRRPEANIEIELENRGLRGAEMRLVAFVDWQMGAERRDAVALNAWREGGACMATGAMPGVGWLAAADAGAVPGPGRRAFLGNGDILSPGGFCAAAGEGWTLSVPLALKRGRSCRVRLALGWSQDVPTARKRIRQWRSEPSEPPVARPGLTVQTPDEGLNAMMNTFLPHQVRSARVLGRTGLYQPGGAWGFRDQLQDMLALLHSEPERVREHLLRCAARQFEAGDALHWWHEPCRGVRTRVSDDVLFLPWVAAAYVEHTGDAEVLGEVVPYLEDVPIPEGREDIYADMRPGAASDTLHGHCMHAFRRAARRGSHGLLLMGAGDWNDGMNRVGAQGKGESVWLSQFAIACAERYRRVAPLEEDQVWLWRLGEELRSAVEAHGWDGGWYLRAYDDEGAPLGSSRCEACQIDAISQAWAVLAGLDGARCRRAVDAARDRLINRRDRLIRLLTPPFDGRGTDPGYIRAYPAGVRENGGQYTHGVLWLLLALIRMGDEAGAHEALDMLLPFNHSDTPERARVYRVEPYVMAADVYDRPGMAGRGGWTWYTGAAGWMYGCVLALLGYERRGDRVRLNALLGDWPAASVTVPFGGSRYRLICEKGAARVTLDGAEVDGEYIRMTDDGGDHEAVFPARHPR